MHFGPVRRRSRDDPARACGAGGDGGPEPVLLLDARARSGGWSRRVRSCVSGSCRGALWRWAISRAWCPRRHGSSKVTSVRASRAFTVDARRANWAVVELLRQVGRPKGATSGQVARLAVGTEAVDRADPGTTKIAHLDENLGALDLELDAQDLKTLADGFATIRVQGPNTGGRWQRSTSATGPARVRPAGTASHRCRRESGRCFTPSPWKVTQQ
jgi:hypothetical protein